jgi:4-carboxymuconolactone decarboxylase
MASVPGLDRIETTVLAFVSELCGSGTVGAATFADTHTVLGTAALTELLLLVSLYYGLALVLNAADLQIDNHTRLEVI